MLALKNKRQFIAELVHELGHYSGSNKVPAYYLISVVHRWLENRELVPTALDATTRHPVPENYRPSAAVWVLEKAAELPRAFVTFLLSLSSRINRRVVDWVQYSADYYTAYILGSEHFNEFLKDQKIAHATYRTVNDINAQAWKHHKLLRDIPAAVVSQYQQWSEDELRNILDQPLQLAEDNWLIPTISDSRMARINKRGFEGVYKDTSSAVNLFIDFTSLCEKVTLEHYKQQYGNDLLAQYIVDNNKIIAMSESLSDAEMALDEFLSGTYTSRLLELAKPTDKALIMLDHQQTIDWIRKHLFEYRNDQKLVKELWHTRQEVRVLIGLIDVGVDVSAIESSIERRSKSELATLLPKAEIEIKALQSNIATVDQMITKRFMMAVVKMSPEDKALSGRYFGMVRKVGGFSVKLRALAEACVLLRHLIAQHNPGGKLLMKIDAVSSECRRLIGGLLSAAVSIAVFSDDDQRSLREYIDSSTKLDTDDLASLSFARMLDIADDIEKVIIYHYTHTLGQLAKLCHRQEARLNIRPLKLVTK